MSNLILSCMNLLATIIAGLMSPLIAPYLVLSEKRRATLLAKLGIKNGIKAPVNPSTRRTIWVHALSVGETLAAVPLVKALRERYPGYPIYFSVSTRSGLVTARRSLGKSADAVFVSTFDFPWAIRRLVWKVNPAAVILVESDVWPNFLQVMHHRQIPVFWANARLSERAYRRFRRMGGLARLLFSRFAGICVQSVEDRERLLDLGVADSGITHCGNIKFDQPTPSLTEDERRRLREQLGLQPAERLLIAGSTHEGEDSLVLSAWEHLRETHPDLHLVVAPRDPGRAPAVAAHFRARGHEPVFWSARTEDVARTTGIMLIDCLGLLKKLYAVADIALMGGSLLDYETVGGHNPLEPAAFATPTVVGPNMKKFPEITRLLKEGRALVQLTDAAELTDALAALLQDPAAARAMGRRAQDVLAANRGAVAQILLTIDAIWTAFPQGSHPVRLRPRRRAAARLVENHPLSTQP